MSISRTTAIAGIGQTEFSKDSGRTELRLAIEAIQAALKDAGLEPKDVTIHIGESSYGRSGGSGGSTTCPGTAPVVYDAAIAARNEFLDKIATRLKAKKDDLSIEPGNLVDKGANKKYAWKEACAKLGMETAVGKATSTNESLAALSGVNVGAAANQFLRDFSMALRCRPHQRGLSAVGFLGIRIGATRQQRT